MKMELFLCMMLVLGVRFKNSIPICSMSCLSMRCLTFPQMMCAGYTEIVQLLMNSANDTECVKRMLEAVDAEGDTVSIINHTLLLFYYESPMVNRNNS